MDPEPRVHAHLTPDESGFITECGLTGGGGLTHKMHGASS